MYIGVKYMATSKAYSFFRHAYVRRKPLPTIKTRRKTEIMFNSDAAWILSVHFIVEYHTLLSSLQVSCVVDDFGIVYAGILMK